MEISHAPKTDLKYIAECLQKSKELLGIEYFRKTLNLRCLTSFLKYLCIIYWPSHTLHSVTLKRFYKITNIFETAPNSDFLLRHASARPTYKLRTFLFKYFRTKVFFHFCYQLPMQRRKRKSLFFNFLKFRNLI